MPKPSVGREAVVGALPTTGGPRLLVRPGTLHQWRSHEVLQEGLVVPSRIVLLCAFIRAEGVPRSPELLRCPLALLHMLDELLVLGVLLLREGCVRCRSHEVLQGLQGVLRGVRVHGTGGAPEDRAMPPPSLLEIVRGPLSLLDVHHQPVALGHGGGYDELAAPELDLHEEVLEVLDGPGRRISLPATSALAEAPPQVMAAGFPLQGLDGLNQLPVLRAALWYGPRGHRRCHRGPLRRDGGGVVSPLGSHAHRGRGSRGQADAGRIRLNKKGRQLAVLPVRRVLLAPPRVTEHVPHLAAVAVLLNRLDMRHRLGELEVSFHQRGSRRKGR
mmetsp:Transcript_166281/g.534005  ORF Transcript_166281/g.534005 Transcript_166281/m.534005 type:complete len:330 (+) Transcript_166281:44-1033(+)